MTLLEKIDVAINMTLIDFFLFVSIKSTKIVSRLILSLQKHTLAKIDEEIEKQKGRIKNGELDKI